MKTKLFRSRTACPKTLAGRLRIACATRLLLGLVLAVPASLQGQFTYTTTNGTITITGYTGPGGAVTIPGTINELPVTSIGDGAFCSGANPQRDILTSVSIPDSVTSIGGGAFAWCGRLSSATLGQGLISIGAGAFADCGLTTITMPSRVISIGGNAFAYCRLISAFFQGNAPSGDSSVFAGDGNIVYYLPGTTGWGPTFGGRPTASWDPPVPWLYTTANGAVTITGYTGPGGAVTIPGTINGLPVTSLGDDAFFLCTNLTSITIPTSVTTIGYDAFAGCGRLTSIDIPNSVTRIRAVAFAGCTALRSVTISTNLALIDAHTFDGCTSLTSIAIPNGVTTIEAWAFQNCSSLPNVAIPASVTSISCVAFYSCTSLTAITVDTNNPTYSSLDGVLLNRSLTTFLQCPGGITGSYTIPDGVTTVAYEAFYLCIKLTSITVPSNVTNIADQAFYWCTGLKGVYFSGNAPSLGGSLVIAGDNLATVYYLPGTTGWGTTFAGLQTALWNPQVQTADASFGIRGNQFGFNITGTANIPVVVEAATDLANPVWSPLQTMTLTNGLVYFSDPQWTNYPSRFYRLRGP